MFNSIFSFVYLSCGDMDFLERMDDESGQIAFGLKEKLSSNN